MLCRLALLLVIAAAGACSRVVDTTIHDTTLTAAVVTALLNSTAVDGTLVTVRTEGGVVHLEGTQPTDAAAAMVVSTTRAVTGVRDVQSSIAVEPSGAEP